jgi:hypothetical protein
LLPATSLCQGSSCIHSTPWHHDPGTGVCNGIVVSWFRTRRCTSSGAVGC